MNGAVSSTTCVLGTIRSERGSKVTYAQFIQSVAARPTVSPTLAEPITRATLETLAERISGGQAWDLPSQPPLNRAQT